MRIATWNVERLKHHRSLDEIVAACERIQADILVLTESDERICPKYLHSFHTPSPPDLKLPAFDEPLHYQPTEHRVSIFTNYPCIRQHSTFDAHTALCVELDTPAGSLLVYGTIVGILGNRHKSFEQDLSQQIADWKRLTAKHENLCVCGDFNCSFADNYYFTMSGRAMLQQGFQDCGMRILTESVPHCIDHIAISERMIAQGDLQIGEWNQEKTLSDHKGICVDLP